MSTTHLVAYEPLSPDVVIPLVVPAVTYGAIIAIVAIVFYFRYRAQQMRQELYKTYIEKGEPIPEALLGRPAPQARNGDLRRGLVLLAGGFGLSVALFFAQERDAVGFGLIPALIGIAYLVVWKVERSSPESLRS